MLLNDKIMNFVFCCVGPISNKIFDKWCRWNRKTKNFQLTQIRTASVITKILTHLTPLSLRHPILNIMVYDTPIKSVSFTFQVILFSCKTTFITSVAPNFTQEGVLSHLAGGSTSNRNQFTICWICFLVWAIILAI